MDLTDSNTSRLSRRQALVGGAALTAGVGGGVIAAREYLSPRETAEAQAPVLEDDDPDKEFTVTATVGEIEVAPGKRVETWLYNDQYPGPELRVEEGDRVQITVKNELDAETTIHWHGMALSGANGMNGVPGVTQVPIAPATSSSTSSMQHRQGPTGTTATSTFNWIVAFSVHSSSRKLTHTSTTTANRRSFSMNTSLTPLESNPRVEE